MHPKIHLCSISSPQPEHPNTFLSATVGFGAAGGALLAAQSHPYPKHCQETSSRKSNLLRKTCLPLSTALFTDAGSRHASGKISAMVPGSEALPGLLSGAAAPQGPRIALGCHLAGCDLSPGYLLPQSEVRTLAANGITQASPGGLVQLQRGHLPAASSHPET